MTDQPPPDNSLPAVISRAVSAAGYWLPGPGCDAAAQAVAGDLDTARRRAVALVERIDAGRAWARRNLTVEQQAGLFAALRGNGKPHVCRPGASVYYCPTSDSTESTCHGGFDVCCDRPDLHQLACGHCGGTGADPEDPGDYDPAVHQHNPGTRGPCPECIQKGLPPRLDLAPAEVTPLLADAFEIPLHLIETTQPVEHCGHQLPPLIGDGPVTECVLRPGHQGSHANEYGARWIETPAAIGLGGDKVDLRKHDVDLATAQASRNRWRSDYAQLAETYKRVYSRADRAEAATARVRDELAAIETDALAPRAVIQRLRTALEPQQPTA